jgi:hypothetical protein
MNINLTIDEQENEKLKWIMENDPLIPRTTKTFVIEYNIRFNDGERKNETIVFEKSQAEEELMNQGICSADICLMQFDIEGECPKAQRPITYDRAVVRTNKPKEYWTLHFK